MRKLDVAFKNEHLHIFKINMDMLNVALFAVVAGTIYSQRLVKLSPEKAEVIEGESAVFTCLSEDIGKYMQWTWSSSNGQYFLTYSYRDRCDIVLGLENTSLYSVYCNVSRTSVLLIRNITRSRHGERWECNFDSEFRSGRSNSAIVYVIVPVASVQLDSTENTISPKENNDLHLSCSTSFARPAPNITWYLTKTISGSESQIPLLDNNVLQITNSTDELFSSKSELLVRVNRSLDGQRLYCAASNHPGIIVSSSTIIFDVQFIVSFFAKGFEGKDTITVVENDTVQFTCLISTVASNAQLTFHWKTILVEEFDTTNLTYTLRQVSCKDTGVYTCVDRNSLNNGKLSFGHLTLLVKCPPRVRPNVPIKEKVLATLGDIITINIDFIAYPEPRLSDFVWLKLTHANWTKINNSLHRDIAVRGLQTNLTIKRVTEEDYGKYRLTVVNELGAFSQNFTLEKVKTEENTNVIAIVIGSVIGFVVLVGIISVAIFLTRKANRKREFPCISMIMKWKGGKKTSTIWKTSSSAAVESNENSSSRGPQNIYEQLQRNGDVEKEYQEIQLGADDKCVYKNIQLHPPPANS